MTVGTLEPAPGAPAGSATDGPARRRPGPRSGLRLLLALGALVVVAVAGTGAGLALRGDRAPQPSAVDVGFSQDMAAHHQQAILLAGLVDGRTSTPGITVLARQILLDQATERGTLTGWLTLWHVPQLPTGPAMAWMDGHMTGGTMNDAPMTGGAMPGMASQEQIDQLAASRGAAFDLLFCHLMIAHHDGGIAMAQDAAQRASLPEVRALAGRMVVDETQEVTMLRRLVTA